LNGKTVGLYIAQASDWTIAFTPYWHVIGITTTLGVKEHGQKKWTKTGTRTAYNQYQYSAVGANGLAYPIEIEITANATGEKLRMKIETQASEGDTYDSGTQFSITSDIQSPGRRCYHPFDPVVYGDNIHSPPINSEIVPSDFCYVLADGSYTMQSTATTPYGGLPYCLQVNYGPWDTLQFQRFIPVFQNEVVSLQMYLKGSAATSKVQVSLNGVGGNAGASKAYFPKITTEWSLFTLYLNSSDIPAQITDIYFQYLVDGDITIYYNNVQFEVKNKAEAGGPYRRAFEEFLASEAAALNSWVPDIY